MKKHFQTFFGSFLFLVVSAQCLAADDAGYETVALDGRETISGKMLVIVAYAVIFGFLSLYAWSIARREQKVQKSLNALKRSIDSKK